MEKASLKKFAVDARRKLIEDVKFQLGLYGITENGILEPQTGTDSALIFDLGNGNTQTIKGERYVKQYRNLVEHLRGFYGAANTKQQLDQFAEEMAYTWFNRLIAIRFMEVNRYIPVRVLSSEIKGQNLPDLVKSPFSGDLEFDENEKQQIFALQDANKEDDLFRFLFFKQCNDLNRILPYLFENLDGSDSFSELLVVLSFNDPNGVVYRLVHEVDEAWFDIHAKDDDGNPVGQVQVIGWMYQYYNAEPKDKVFADLKENIKISKENIPAATQLFTPDWIVRYMVENSLGRLWYEGHPDFDKSEWKYYLDEAQQEPQVEQQLAEIRAQYAKIEPEQLKVIDPCMGSGHILCYLFDVLMQIYLDNGYSRREAVRSILENNLFGLDIDKRAAQIAYFSVMMKAREYDTGFFDRSKVTQPKVYDIQESNGINRNQLKFFGNGLSDFERNEARLQLEGLLDILTDAKEYGSLLNMGNYNWDLLRSCADVAGEDAQVSMESVGLEKTVAKLRPLIDIGEALGKKYDVVVTNPPYRGINDVDKKLQSYMQNSYPDSKTDMYSAFIERGKIFATTAGFVSMITQQSWLSLTSFIKLRRKIFSTVDFVNMLQLGAKAFDEIGGEVVSPVAFTFNNIYEAEYSGRYLNLEAGSSEKEKAELFFKAQHTYIAKQDSFKKVPNNVVVYDATEKALQHFEKDLPLNEYVVAKPGMQTSDNDRFLRLWFEVPFQKVGFGLSHSEATESPYKWFPYNKGIGFRKWYGNNDYVVNFYHDGEELKYWLVHNPKDPKTKHWSRNMRNYSSYFENGITFTAIGNSFSARLNGKGYLFDTKGPMMFGSQLEFVCGFTNSVVFDLYNRMLCKQLTKNFDSVNLVPMSLPETQIKNDVSEIVETCKENSKFDWDSFETSWDFAEHPLVKWSHDLWDGTSIAATMDYYYHGERPNVSCPVELCYMLWQGECNDRFAKLKANEEELNRIFIDIYGLQDELTPEVEDKDVTVRKADLSRDIRSLLSYAVGCILGRYSLDKPGLAYAGGEWDAGKYSRFQPVIDNVVPLCDEEYFGENDLVNRVVDFIKEVFGAASLEENLAYIAKALGNKGNTSREVIRNYFLKDFFADHCKIYQKRPIYWMFDSGKKNGFKALVYLHRWDADTTGRVNNNYLSPLLRTYAQQIVQENNVISASSDARTVSLAQKRLDKLKLRQAECEKYEKNIAHLAGLRIALDLDDGVKVNYVKAQTAADGKNLNVLAPLK